MGRIERLLAALACLGGLTSVVAGAFAAHGMADPLMKDVVRTGSTYGLVHSLAVFAALGLGRSRWAAILFLGGALLFSGSLYALALGAPHWLGAVTPLGGLSFMAGWAALGWACLAQRKPA
ncbi:MAG: DUF423 domain-containing protein [Caulobacteraceae bacterium]|jgi:uncharacterized membrane protein YgdD (TMEM256/DUF423 family)